MRFILFILLLVGLGFAGNWLLAYPGEVTIAWLGYDVQMHTIVVAAILFLLVALVAFITVLFWQVITWPKRRRVRRQHRTFTRGLAQLTRGVTALAMGDEDGAHEALKKAMTALPGEPLPQLLTAQLLQRQGKYDDARLQFRALMSHPLTTELATRRLIEQHVAQHEWLEAAKFAELARESTPHDRWLVVTLIDLYARMNETAKMLALTEGWQWQSPLEKPERNHYAALAHYLAATTQEDLRRKEQSLRHAVGYAPEFIPAIIDYAGVLQAEGSPRRARKWLREAWLAAPNTLLIAPILATMADQSPRAQSRLLQPFLRGELTVPHYLLAAQQALDVDEPARAREFLEEALDLEESKLACTLMAEVETELRGGDAANAWLARAIEAPVGATWVCDACGVMHPQWQAHCSGCQSFDTLHYERPEARITSVELATR